MLYVSPQPEPVDFDEKVRQKGLAHLADKGIALDRPLSKGTKINSYWTGCLPELYAAYSGVCAYVAVHFERVTANGSVDHFVAKSSRADLSYEWSNYRLACGRMNSRKNKYDDVLDPFSLTNGLFHLECVTGRIYPNPAADNDVKELVNQTIKRLGLDDPDCRELRARHFSEYISKQFDRTYFRRISPFVWHEANRQGLL